MFSIFQLMFLRRETFDRLDDWLKEIKDNADERIIKTLIGTQSDKEQE